MYEFLMNYCYDAKSPVGMELSKVSSRRQLRYEKFLFAVEKLAGVLRLYSVASYTLLGLHNDERLLLK